MSATDTLTVALVQINAGRDTGHNMAKIERWAGRLPRVDLVALPEVFALRGSDGDYRQAAEPIPGPITERLSLLARRRSTWVLAGSLIEKAGKRIFNTSVLLDRSGRITATYRKMHLFEAHLDDGRTIREQDICAPGNCPVTADVDGWLCGMSICYDVRFPELFRRYSSLGARVLLIPSNFTQRTGKDHWDILVRARAIENQCYVIAPNQCGGNPSTGVISHGHSMAVGPWGEVLCEAGRNEAVLTAELSRAAIEQTRRRVPALEHRRSRL